MKKQEREKYRITIPDCIERIEEQTNGEIPRDAWFPVPSCSPVTHFVEAFTKRPQYELSIHFACGAGTYVFEDKNTKSLVPITSFVDLKGLFEYLDEKTDELNSGSNKYLVAAKFISRLNSFIEKDKQPAGLNLAKLSPAGCLSFSMKLLSLLMKDRKSTRLNSSHGSISYAVFCLKKKKLTTV